MDLIKGFFIDFPFQIFFGICCAYELGSDFKRDRTLGIENVHHDVALPLVLVDLLQRWDIGIQGPIKIDFIAPHILYALNRVRSAF